MNNTLNFLIQFQTNAEKVSASVKKLSAETLNVETASDKVNNSFNKTIESINSKIKSINTMAVIQQIQGVAQGFEDVAKPGLDFSTNMADLSAITGQTGKSLDLIGEAARRNSKEFGGSASESVESYKLLLSQLTPEIAKQPKALEAMGKSVSVLSKTMGGDTVAATEVLTTAMNQFQVSTDNPIQASKEMSDMMNIMAASAKEGSAELPQIKQALENSGMAAKAAGVSFAETNAAIQVLDKAGKKGAEGGVALRNIMGKLMEGRFLPKETTEELQKAGININALGDKNKTLADRLKLLKPILNDNALITKMFGTENANAALALINGISEQERLTKAVQGTNTAYEQAAVIMESPVEKNKRLQSQVDDFKISIFNASNGMLGYMGVLSNLTMTMTNLWPAINFGVTAVKTLTSVSKMQALWSTILDAKTKVVTFSTGLWTTAQTYLNAAMTANPIGLIIVAIVALVAIIYVAIDNFHKFGSAILFLMGPIGWLINGIMAIKNNWDSIVKAFQTDGILGGLKRIGVVLLDVVLYPIQQLLEMLAKIPGLSNLAGKGAQSIKDIRAKLDLVSPSEKAAKTQTAKTKTDKAVKGTSKGILPVPGTDPTGKGGKNNTGKEGKKTNEAIATGGTKHNYITLNIKDVIGQIQISGKDFKENAVEMQKQIEEGVLRALAMATTTAG